MLQKAKKSKDAGKKRDKLKLFVFSLSGLLIISVGLLCIYEIQRRSGKQEDIGFLPETGMPVVFIADDPYVPSGTERPEDHGWIYLGDGFDTTTFDIDSIDFKGAPRKIRYVMFLNGSEITCGDCVGADPDGVTGYHTVGGGLSYGKAIYTVDTAPRGSAHGKKCENFYTCTLHANRVLGEPEDCGSTKNCGCCLGKDPTPSLDARDAQGGFIIIDMACNDIDTSGQYRKCRSSEAEDHSQVIVGDGTSAVDMIFYEVGCSEHYFLYAYPYWIPPQVEVKPPPDCADEATITIEVTGLKASQTIDKFWLYLNNDVSGPWVVTSDRSGVYLDDADGSDISYTSTNFSESITGATLSITVNGLKEMYGNTDSVEVYAQVEDNSGRLSDKVLGGSFSTGRGPEVTIGSISFVGADLVEVPWTINPIPRNYPPSNCVIKWHVRGTSDWSVQSLPECASYAGGILIGSTVITGIDPDKSYEFQVEATTCEIGTATEETAAPWLMTHLGDTYASNGYTMEMQSIDSYESLGVYPGSAYFSYYLISSGTSDIYIAKSSRMLYEMTNYSDNNADSGNFSIYEELLSLAEENDCDIKDRSDLPIDGCNGVYIYFIPDGGQINLTGGWLNQPASNDRACIIVTKENVVVSAGESDIDKMDVFVITEKQFKTESDNEILLINGSVIANSVDFNRNLVQKNPDDPSEVIKYDSKYFNYFRNCLGMSYPFKFREYQYSGFSDE